MIYLPILIGLVVFAVFACIAGRLFKRNTEREDLLAALTITLGAIAAIAACVESRADIADGRFDGRAPSMEARKMLGVAE